MNTENTACRRMRRARQFLLGAAAGAALVLGTSLAHSGVVVGTAFEGTSVLDNCALGECYRPPDTMGAVGTTQYLETSNGSVTVYNKATGAVVSREGMNAFWTRVGQTTGNGDQRVLFDHYTNRWIVIGFGSTVDKINIAVSETADATGNWKSTSFVGFAGGVADYPTLGMDDKGVYIGTNNYSSSDVFQGTSLFVIPKSDLFGVTPSTANMTTFNSTTSDPDRGYSIQGAVNWGGNPTNVANIVAVSRDQFDIFTYKVNGVNAAGATQTAINELNVATYAYPGPGRQPDGTRLVDTLDDRISANVYESNGMLYVVQTVTPVGGSYTELRWYVVDAATGVVISTGTIGGDDYDYYQGSIAVNEFGRVVIGYNRSGFSTADTNSDGKEDGSISFFAQAFVTNAGGGLDAYGAATLLRVSDVIDYHCGPRDPISLACRQRWGDYSAVTIDPIDHDRFWVIGEYAANWALLPGYEDLGERAVWHTYIAEIAFVPEPQSVALVLIGLAMLGVAQRRLVSSRS